MEMFLLQLVSFIEWRGTPTLAIFMSVAMAYFAIRNSQDLSRKKNTIDVLFKTKNDEKFYSSMETIAKVHRDESDDISKYAYDVHKTHDITCDLRYILNLFEMISVGIKRNIYDEQVLKESWHRIMTETWTCSKSFIDKIREIRGAATYSIEYESLMIKWIDNPLLQDYKKKWYYLWMK